MLLAGTLAVALAILGYLVLLALRIVPVGAGDAAQLAVMPVLPDPARLPRRPSFTPASAGGEPRAWPLAARRLEVAVDGLPEPLPGDAGIGVFDAEGFSRGWWKLPAATGDTTTLQLVVDVPQGPLQVVVAGGEGQARRGYWSKKEVAVDQAGPVRLSAAVQPVVVHAGAVDQAQAKALRLYRQDDPEWVPFGVFAPPLRADQSGDVTLTLGPGTYLLEPWTRGPWQPFLITVPGPREVTASFRP